MTVINIIQTLDYYFHDKAKYKLSNAYVFTWESDYFVQRLNNYIYELEIKVSRADYFADFKKTEKHKALRGEHTKLKIPNKFIKRSVKPTDAVGSVGCKRQKMQNNLVD